MDFSSDGADSFTYLGFVAEQRHPLVEQRLMMRPEELLEEQ